MKVQHKRVVILGGGYAGVRVARDLARQVKTVPLEIMLISDQLQHTDISKLYEVATAYLEEESSPALDTIHASVGIPLAQALRGLPVQIVIARIERINLSERSVICDDDRAFSYDILVVALGSRLATFGIPGVVEHAFSVKTAPEALLVRHHIVRQFFGAKKLAERTAQEALRFVVVGGGAAGVETVAELAGQVAHQRAKHELPAQAVSLHLIEAGPRILSMVSEPLAARAARRLTALGVKLHTACAVRKVTPEGIECASGLRLNARTVIWTGGLMPHPVVAASGLPLLQRGVRTRLTLQAEQYPTVFVVGDAAVLPDIVPPVPATVPVAYSQAAHAARNISRLLQGKPLEPYRAKRLGALIALGATQALVVTQSGRGWIGISAWLLKQAITVNYWRTYLSLPGAVRFTLQSVRLHRTND
jgi:NADH dehydrogenase